MMSHWKEMYSRLFLSCYYKKPQYDWSLVKWHEGTPLLDNVINKKDQGMITELEVVMDYIVSDTEKRGLSR